MSSKGDAYYAVGKNKFLLDVSSLPAKPYLIDDSVDGKEAKRNVNINASGDYEFDKWNGKEYEKVAVEIKEGVLEIPDKSKPKLDDIVFNSPNRKIPGIPLRFVVVTFNDTARQAASLLLDLAFSLRL